MRYELFESEARYARLGAAVRAVDWKGGGFDDFDLRPFLEKVLPTLRLPAARPTALEYGTGTGPGACFLAARGFRVDAIDISPTAIQLARRFAAERGIEVAFEVGDICEFSAGAPGYDLVLDNFCLQRIVARERRARALSKVRSVVKARGYFLIATVLFREGRDFGEDLFDAQTGIHYRRLHGAGAAFEDAVRIRQAWYAPVRRYPRADELRAELEDAGFAVVRQLEGRAVCVPRGRAP